MLEIKKKDRFTVKITDHTDEGLGVGKIRLPETESFFPLFIKNTAVGDVVTAEVIKVKNTYGYGRLLEIIEASGDRKDPGCAVFGKCGGCQLRHIQYRSQLSWKEKRVADVMERVGGVRAGDDFEYYPVIGMDDTLRYRNKAQYPVGKRDGKTVTGFFAGRTHAIVPVEDCLIEHEANAVLLKYIRDFWDKKGLSVYDEKTGDGFLRHILIRTAFSTGDIMICLVVNSVKEKCEHAKELKELGELLSRNKSVRSFIVNFNDKKTNVIMGRDETLIFGEPFIIDSIGDVRFRISAGSFFQVNPAQTVKLYKKTLEFADLNGSETVWDLYCGTGSISLFLAQKAGRVYGVEVFEKAVEDAKENARINGIKNAFFLVSKAEDIATDPDIPSPDVIVVDPPRKGCDATLLETIGATGAGRLVYVSCNPATLARDTAILKDIGFALKKLQPVDMFPETTGVENVALFEKH